MTVGSVHGRFQPFHNGHLEYVLAAQRLCDFLWIGITKCDIAPVDSVQPGRSRERPENNPLTFFERLEIIAEALTSLGIDRGAFGFVPFPIENPERLHEFMPVLVPCYTTICEPWNEEKIQTLKKAGYDVRVLYRKEPKTVTGSHIRRDIVAGSESWKGLVPDATVRAVERLQLRDRLLRLQTGSVTDTVTL